MKKYFLFALLAFVILSFTGCVEIEDTISAESLAVDIFDDKIITQGTNEVTFSSVKTTVRNQETLAHGELSGAWDLYKGTAAGETVSLTVDCNVTAGEARLVLVYGGEIVHEFDLHKEGQTFVLENANGDFALTIAGKSATFEVKVKIGE